MSADEAVTKRFHGINQEVSEDGLYYIFYEFRSVVFKPLPFLIGSDSFVGDRFPAKLIFTDVGLDVGQLSAGW